MCSEVIGMCFTRKDIAKFEQKLEQTFNNRIKQEQGKH